MERRNFLFSSATFFAVSAPALHGQVTVWPDVEVYFLLDVSGSMFSKTSSPSGKHFIVQREGHIVALNDETVRKLLLQQHAVVHIVEWAGAQTAREITPLGGILVRNYSDIDEIVNIVQIQSRTNTVANAGTDHASALEFVLSKKRQAPRVIVDISTDEPPDDVPGVKLRLKRMQGLSARRRTTVNVLAVELEPYPIN